MTLYGSEFIAVLFNGLQRRKTLQDFPAFDSSVSVYLERGSAFFLSPWILWMFRDNRWFQMVFSLPWRFPPTLPMNRRALSFHQETLGFAWLWGGASPLYISQQNRGPGAQASGLANLPTQHSSSTRLLISWAILLNFLSLVLVILAWLISSFRFSESS